MSKIARCLQELKAAHRCALIPYLAAGDPHPDTTVTLMHALVASGADLIELGVPFSDPMADGPIIQAAYERALKHHVALLDVMQLVDDFRQDDPQTPVILMSYLNPIEKMGYAVFIETASQSGVDGVLVVDMPIDEAGQFANQLHTQAIDPIFMLSPTSSDERIQKTTDMASGFLYYVALKGVTGADHLDSQSVIEQVQHIRKQSQLPIGVGFGIRDAATAASLAGIADAVIVGSALVDMIHTHHQDPDELILQIQGLMTSMSKALEMAS